MKLHINKEREEYQCHHPGHRVPGKENKPREEIFEEIIKRTLEVKKDEGSQFERAPNIPRRTNTKKTHSYDNKHILKV